MDHFQEMEHFQEIAQKIILKIDIFQAFFGNCWYEGCIDQMRQIGPTKPGLLTAFDLRKAVASSIVNHPLFVSHWLPIAFENNLDKAKEFIEQQKREGVYSDENGVITLATATFLNVQI